MVTFKRIRLLLAFVVFLASAGYIVVPAETQKQALDSLLKSTLKAKFQQKEIREIYLSGPSKTFNACGSAT